MSAAANAAQSSLHLRLPATSANLGPGFDAVAVALDFHLEIEAAPAAGFSIAAQGRDRERCSSLNDHLILEAYKSLLRREGRPIVPLAIRMDNGIPLGMGCGSSAAGRLAAIALAARFGRLEWDHARILKEACALEGHPDNISACWLGGFVAAACSDGSFHYARFDPPPQWRAIVVLPAQPLATSKARSVLPERYSLRDAVSNIQSVALLSAAFAQGRPELLAMAMRDRIHQPYREPFCPLLPLLLPLVGARGIAGAALSGAGPAVLMVVDSAQHLDSAQDAIRCVLQGQPPAELLACRFSAVGVEQLTTLT